MYVNVTFHLVPSIYNAAKKADTGSSPSLHQSEAAALQI